MTTRRINWTGRKRITRDKARVSLISDAGLRFELDLDVAGMELPGNAKVTVHAYSGTFSMQFDFGTVDHIRRPASTDLTEFDEPEGVLFRVKILGAGDLDGRILAEADQLRPFRPDDDLSGREPLLVPRGVDLGQLVWKLEIDQTAGPDFQVNNTLGNWQEIARMPTFVWLVYPEVLSRILAAAADTAEDVASNDAWQTRWLQFANTVPGAPPCPEDAESDDYTDWAQDVADAFARQHKLRDRFLPHLVRGDE